LTSQEFEAARHKREQSKWDNRRARAAAWKAQQPRPSGIQSDSAASEFAHIPDEDDSIDSAMRGD
jgi:hypothetical protein